MIHAVPTRPRRPRPAAESGRLIDPRYADRSDRKANAPALVAEIEAELLRQPAPYWEEALQKAGVPAARLATLPEALDTPHTRARGFVQDSGDGTRVPTLPFRLGHAGAYTPSRPAPPHGADSDALKRWLDGDAPFPEGDST